MGTEAKKTGKTGLTAGFFSGRKNQVEPVCSWFLGFFLVVCVLGV